MDAAIRERFAKVKALMSSPNAGEAAAAKARYDEMVARHGDPDAARHERAEAWSRVKAAANSPTRRYTFADAFADLYGGSPEINAAAQRAARDVAAYREYGKLCGEAVTWLMDSCGLTVDGVVGGPWTIYDEFDEPIGPLDMQGVIGYAAARGF